MKAKFCQWSILPFFIGLTVWAYVNPHSEAQETATIPAYEVVLRSDVKFQPLNPLRGDKSPRDGLAACG